MHNTTSLPATPTTDTNLPYRLDALDDIAALFVIATPAYLIYLMIFA